MTFKLFLHCVTCELEVEFFFCGAAALHWQRASARACGGGGQAAPAAGRSKLFLHCFTCELEFFFSGAAGPWHCTQAGTSSAPLCGPAAAAGRRRLPPGAAVTSHMKSPKCETISHNWLYHNYVISHNCEITVFLHDITYEIMCDSDLPVSWVM